MCFWSFISYNLKMVLFGEYGDIISGWLCAYMKWKHGNQFGVWKLIMEIQKQPAKPRLSTNTIKQIIFSNRFLYYCIIITMDQY